MPKTPITILIADDHALVRSGLRHVLETDGKYHLVEAEHGGRAWDLIRSEKPTIAILDIDMPELSGYEVAQRVREAALPVSIVFLTMHNDEHLFNKALDAGAKGYVLKENTVSDLLECVKAVAAGKHYLSPALSDFILRRNNRAAGYHFDKSGLDQLTPAEKAVLKLLAGLKTNQDIAAGLGISIKTVQNHRNNICTKLGLRGAHALLKFAVDNAGRL